MRQICCLLAIICLGTTAIVLALYDDPIEADYRKYNMINGESDIQSVIKILGVGRRVDISKIPTRQSQKRIGNEPVVNGHCIYVWDRGDYEIYIGFDEEGKFVSKFFREQSL